MPAAVLLVAGALALAALGGVAWGRTRCGHQDTTASTSVDKTRPEIADWYSYQPLHNGWKGHPDGLLLPTIVVVDFADRDLLSSQRLRHAADIAHWAAVLAAEGQQEPFELTVDQFGRAKLADGYRRLAAARQLGIPAVAVTVRRVRQLHQAPQIIDVLMRHRAALKWNEPK